MARHDRGRGLAERAGLHVMGKVGDDRAVHLEVDLDGRTAQLGMRGGAGVGRGEPSEPGYIAGQFDDALVVDVVQHKIEVSRLPAATALGERGLQALYMGWQRRKYSPAISLRRLKWKPVRPAAAHIYCGTQASGGKPPRLPVTLRSYQDRSNGVDMDALIKSLRPGKPSDVKAFRSEGFRVKSSEAKSRMPVRPSSILPNFWPPRYAPTSRDPRAPKPSRRCRPCCAISARTPDREGLLDTPRRVVEAFDELYQGYHQCPGRGAQPHLRRNRGL